MATASTTAFADSVHLEVFLRCATRYFEECTDEAPVLGTPYLLNAGIIPYTYMGAIAVSGNAKGTVVFAANAPLLQQLLMDLGEAEPPDDMLEGAAGEVANTLSGNARETLSHHFVISTPSVSTREGGTQLQTRSPMIGVPVHWKGHEGMIVLALTTVEGGRAGANAY